MTRTTLRFSTFAAVVAVGALALVGCSSGTTDTSTSEPTTSSAPVTGSVPDFTSIAALGDSMTAGQAACGENAPCESASWSTGDDPTVDSIASRLAAQTGTAPEVLNVAKPGAKVSELAGQVTKVVAAGPQLVTVLIGSNDACAPSMAEVTLPAAFASQADQLLTSLSTGLPDSTIFVGSIPDLEQFFDLERADAQATALWSKSPACRSLLYDPASDAQEDVQRRATVSGYIDDYNTALQASCAKLPNCISDGGAIHGAPVTTADISTVDHFHPSLQGQSTLAEVAWGALSAAG